MSPGSSPRIGLESLSIRNFRGIDHLDLDFCRPDGLPNRLIVLAGPNGCGKTTVLEAALTAVGGHRLAVGPRGRHAVRKGAERYEIRARLLDRGRLFDEHLERVATSSGPATVPDPPLPFWYFSSWRAPNFMGAVNVTVGTPGRRLAKTDLNRLFSVKQQLTNAAAAQSFPGAERPFLRTYSDWITRINAAWDTFYNGRGDEFAVGLVDSGKQGGGAFEVYYRRQGAPPLPVDWNCSGS